MNERLFSHDRSADGRLSLHGDLDEATVREMRELIHTASDGLTHDLVVDLTDVDLLPSSAVGVLATAQDAAGRHGATLTLVAGPETIASRVLTICGLEHERS